MHLLVPPCYEAFNGAPVKLEGYVSVIDLSGCFLSVLIIIYRAIHVLLRHTSILIICSLWSYVQLYNYQYEWFFLFIFRKLRLSAQQELLMEDASLPRSLPRMFEENELGQLSWDVGVGEFGVLWVHFGVQNGVNINLSRDLLNTDYPPRCTVFWSLAARVVCFMFMCRTNSMSFQAHTHAVN